MFPLVMDTSCGCGPLCFIYVPEGGCMYLYFPRCLPPSNDPSDRIFTQKDGPFQGEHAADQPPMSRVMVCPTCMTSKDRMKFISTDVLVRFCANSGETICATEGSIELLSIFTYGCPALRSLLILLKRGEKRDNFTADIIDLLKEFRILTP